MKRIFNAMKTAIVAVAILSPFSVNAEGLSTSLNHRGWVTSIYATTDHNKIPEEGFNIEAALQLNFKIGNYIDINALGVYESAYDDTRPVEINYLFAKLGMKENGNTIHYKIGRLQMPFGFWADTKMTPERPFVLQYYPMNMVWTYNRRLFTNLDGHTVKVIQSRGKFYSELEFGSGSRKDLTPEVEYVQNLEGIYPVKQTVDKAIELKINYGGFRYRRIYLEMATEFFVPEEHYENFPFMYAPKKYYGEATIEYKYNYDGVEYYTNEIAVTLERIQFHYTGEGSANEYYNAVLGKSLPVQSTNYFHGMIRYYYESAIIWYDHGYGVSSAGDIKSAFNGFGFTYDWSANIKIKGQFVDVHGVQWLTWNENPSKPPLVSEDQSQPHQIWKIYATSITYIF